MHTEREKTGRNRGVEVKRLDRKKGKEVYSFERGKGRGGDMHSWRVCISSGKGRR